MTSFARIATLGMAGLVAAALTSACGPDEPAPGTIRALTADGGVIVDSAPVFKGLKYPLDGEKYAKWVVAQRALDAIPDLRVPTRVRLQDFTEDDVDEAADWLEEHEAANAAIRSADISPEDYVRTSVALEQLMATMTATHPTRFVDMPAGNADVIGRQPDFRETFAARRVRVVASDDAPRSVRAGDDGDSDSGNRGKKKGKQKGKKDKN